MKYSNLFPNLIIKSCKFDCHDNDRDLLSYSYIKSFLNQLKDMDAIIVGDAFWPTGQNICRWTRENKKKCILLQHGQWIYYEDKKTIKHIPDIFCLFGDNIVNKCSQWPISSKTKFIAVGNPKYDNIVNCSNNGSVYFSPPVIEEIVHNKPNGIINRTNREQIKELSLSKIFDTVPCFIQPHYREAKISDIKTMFPNLQIINPKDNPLEYIKKSKSVLCSRDSTVVLDSIACDKMPVILDYKNDSKRTFKKGYFGVCAKESSTLNELINNLRNSYDYNPSIEEKNKHIYPCGSSVRFLNIINEELNKND